MVWNFVIQLAIGLALSVISYLLTPRPKQQQPDATKDIEKPTSETGRPIPVVFGTLTIKSPNCLFYTDVVKHTYNTDSE